MRHMSFFSKILRNGSKSGLPRVGEDRLILFSRNDTKENYLSAFWRWVAILADDDYQLGLEALWWPNGTTWTAEKFKDRIATFFGGGVAWTVVVPNERLVGVINGNADFEPRGNNEFGWLRAQIPLTNEPADPKRDEIPLMGLASSFFVRPRGEHYVLEFEIFHL
jgi:hypothetical protein